MYYIVYENKDEELREEFPGTYQAYNDMCDILDVNHAHYNASCHEGIRYGQAIDVQELASSVAR